MGGFVHREDAVKLNAVDDCRHIGRKLANRAGSVFFLIVDGYVNRVVAAAFKLVFPFEYDREKNFARFLFQGENFGKLDTIEIKFGKFVNRERVACLIVKDRGERVVVVGGNA